jgi:hypothetical protein
MTVILIVPNARDRMGTSTLGPSSTFSKPHRLVLNKQLDIVKGVLASPCASRSNRNIVVSHSHAIEVGT